MDANDEIALFPKDKTDEKRPSEGADASPAAKEEKVRASIDNTATKTPDENAKAASVSEPPADVKGSSAAQGSVAGEGARPSGEKVRGSAEKVRGSGEIVREPGEGVKGSDEGGARSSDPPDASAATPDKPDEMGDQEDKDMLKTIRTQRKSLTTGLVTGIDQRRSVTSVHRGSVHSGSEQVVSAEVELPLPKEEVVANLADDFFYDYDALARQAHVEYYPDVAANEKLTVSERAEKAAEKEEKATEEAEKKGSPKEEVSPGLPVNLMTLHHSFGYDCVTRINLFMLEPAVLCFIAGNFVVIFDVKTKTQRYLRSTGGHSIGSLAIHPSKMYFAIGENGTYPDINVFEYPSLRLYRIQRKNAERGYADLDFSPNGSLLASVSSSPDYILTIWNWKRERIVLSCKAFSQDVYHVRFSAEMAGELVTSGLGHIRFWKMARTFTGLKLQGELGKFGKHEISDIEAVVELSDGKALSGSEKGGILLWDGGLCTVEFQRFGNKSCHVGPIQQIMIVEGELFTVGLDGYIRVWELDKVESAEVEDDKLIVELELLHELKIGVDAGMRHLIKNPLDAFGWYAQDSSGGIWTIDLSFSFSSDEPDKLMSYHAGPIFACATSPVSNLAVTTGYDGSVRLYDYLSKVQLCRIRFARPANCLLWLPTKVESTGSLILVGFSDGVVRVLRVARETTEVDAYGRKKMNDCLLILVKVMKPHAGEVTCLRLDQECTYLATAGSDSTVFFFDVQEGFAPIGFVRTPSSVTCLEWSPPHFERKTLLISCVKGEVMEVAPPDPKTFDSTHSYLIPDLPTKMFKFLSIKSKILHKMEVEKQEAEIAEKKRKAEEEKKKMKERGLLSEEEEAAAAEAEAAAAAAAEAAAENAEGAEAEEDVEEQKPVEEKWEPEYPATPSPVLVGFYGVEPDKFWLSMGEYDAGFLYECQFGRLSVRQLEEGKTSGTHSEPIRGVHIPGVGDTPVCCIRFTENGRFAVFGLQNGFIHIYQVEGDDLCEFGWCWCQGFHDLNYGDVTNIAFSYDSRFLFSTGLDGNFFVLKITDAESWSISRIPAISLGVHPTTAEAGDATAEDITDPKAHTIEDLKHKKKADLLLELAEKKKAQIRQSIELLRDRFIQVRIRNRMMPARQRLHKKEFVMDPETEIAAKALMEEKLKMMDLETAFKTEKQRVLLDKISRRYMTPVQCVRIAVRAFRTPHVVYSYRTRHPSLRLLEGWAELDQAEAERLLELQHQRKMDELLMGIEKPVEEEVDLNAPYKPGSMVRIDTMQRVKIKGARGNAVNQIIDRINENKRRREFRRQQWKMLHDSKLADDYENPDDVAAIEDAKGNINDFQLKSSDDYFVARHLRPNSQKTCISIILLERNIAERQNKFNDELLQLRQKKVTVLEELDVLAAELSSIHAQLDHENHLPMPVHPELHADEMPEKRYQYTHRILTAWKQARLELLAPERNTDSLSLILDEERVVKVEDELDPSTDTMSTSATKKDKKKKKSGKKRAVKMGMAKHQKHVGRSDMSPKENLVHKANEIRLLHDQDTVLDKINTIITNFDAELRVLRHRRYQLDIELKNAEMRHVTLSQELILLKDFEKVESRYVDKVDSRRLEQKKHKEKISETIGAMDTALKETNRLLARQKELEIDAWAFLEDNKWRDYLFKVYKKKVKRRKPRISSAMSGLDDEEEEFEDEEDESELSDSEDDDEDEDEDEDEEAERYDLDICPLECDKSISASKAAIRNLEVLRCDQVKYDKVCEMREHRTDIVEAMNELKAARDLSAKDLENLNKKLKIVDAGVKQAELELNNFQLKKQGVLNAIDTTVILHIHQLESLDGRRLMEDMSPCLVFEDDNLTTLRRRIRELIAEGVQQKKDRKAEWMKRADLAREKRRTEAFIHDQHTLCDTMMIKKFGKFVDLEKLDLVLVHPTFEEAKDELRICEEICAAERRAMKRKLKAQEEAELAELKENTDLCNEMFQLQRAAKNYAIELNHRQSHECTEFVGENYTEHEDYDRALELTRAQAAELASLRGEIRTLRLKNSRAPDALDQRQCLWNSPSISPDPTHRLLF